MKRKDDVSLQNVGGQDLLVPLGAKVADTKALYEAPTATFVAVRVDEGSTACGFNSYQCGPINCYYS